MANQTPKSPDAWDQPAYTNLHNRSAQGGLKPKSQPPVVRDDWDDDDEEEEEQDSAKIWEEANNKAPMPELIISPASTGQTVLPLPPIAFQPTLRILKRPPPSQSASASSTSLASAQTRSTFAEREAQYQEARNRIFGDECEKVTSEPSVTVVGDPLGPSFESSGQERGGRPGALVIGEEGGSK
ncbi:hypothetical protein BS17DRAFT_778892 [Gyrodon lividus]|nr:hypothetical protein BS17DRAFT_778892 [Gyrodon lividus]